MNKLLIGILLATHFMGCKPVDVLPEPVSPNTTSAVIWKQKLPTNRLVSPPLYHEGKIILAQSNVAQAYDTDSGKLIWETPVRAEPLDFEGCFLVGEKVVFSDSRRIFCLNSETGKVLWGDDLPQGWGPACHIEGYLYKSSYDADAKRFSSLYRYDLETGNRDLVFRLNIGDYDDQHTPHLYMPVRWKTAGGDELLILQNRSFGWGTTGKTKMDILAWNLTADSMEWYRNLDGFSSTARPAIDGDRVYFYGDRHAYCINPKNGETLWKYFIGNGPEDDFNTANILIVGENLVVKPDSRDMHMVNKITGERVWLNEDTRAMPYMLTERNDTIWFSSGWVLGVDALTGEKLIEWDNDGSGSWIFAVAPDPNNGFIYTSDASNFYCLDPRNMK